MGRSPDEKIHYEEQMPVIFAEFKAKVELEAIEGELIRFGRPDILNVDQGSQLIGFIFTSVFA